MRRMCCIAVVAALTAVALPVASATASGPNPNEPQATLLSCGEADFLVSSEVDPTYTYTVVQEGVTIEEGSLTLAAGTKKEIITIGVRATDNKPHFITVTFGSASISALFIHCGPESAGAGPAGPMGPAGPAGQKGETGPMGPQGPAIQVISAKTKKKKHKHKRHPHTTTRGKKAHFTG